MNRIPIRGVRQAFEGISVSHATRLYVNKSVSVSGNGLTPQRPFKTIQEAVNAANTVANKGKSFDIIVANGYYAEKVNISDAQNAIWSDTVSLAQCIASAGKIRIIADGEVVVSNGAEATGPTFTVSRPAVELVGLTLLGKTATQPAVYIKVEKNTGWGGSDNNGFAAGFKMTGCWVKDVGIGDDVNAGSIGLKFLGSLYSVIENCIFEGFSQGIHQEGSAVGYTIGNRIVNCVFRANTYDIATASSKSAEVRDCVFLTAATEHIYDLATGNADTGCVVAGGYTIETDLAKFKNLPGWAAIGVKCGTAAGIIGDADLSS